MVIGSPFNWVIDPAALFIDALQSLKVIG